MTGVPCLLVDTNVLLRYFIQDDETKAAASKKLVERAAKGKVVLEIPFISVVETMHTLRSFYGVGRQEISREIISFLQSAGMTTSAPPWIWEALELFSKSNVSFGDACIAAEARTSGIAVASFDADFDKLPGVCRVELD